MKFPEFVKENLSQSAANSAVWFSWESWQFENWDVRKFWRLRRLAIFLPSTPPGGQRTKYTVGVEKESMARIDCSITIIS